MLNNKNLWEVMQADTLGAVIYQRALAHPQKIAFSFLGQDDIIQELTYGELFQSASQLALMLSAEYQKGERMVLLYPSGIDFIIAFVACLYADLIAVPVNVPRKSRHLSRLLWVVEDAGAKAVLTDQKTKMLFSENLKEPEFLALSLLPWLDTAVMANISLCDDPAKRDRPRKQLLTQIAFLQYTSGSTSLPKGVMVSHGNLVANLKMMVSAFGMNETSIGVSWLPLFHDMGLIGAVLQVLYTGAHLYLMSPQSFIQNPSRWLRAISTYRADYTVGPNFALEHCVNYINNSDLEQIDLSSLRCFILGSEFIRKSAIDAFAQKMSLCGFAPSVFCPAYGLAEATLFVSGDRLPVSGDRVPVSNDALSHEKTSVFLLSKQGLQAQKAMPPLSQEESLFYMGNGKAWLDESILIVDPNTFQPCQEQEVGEIWVSGSHISQGYWKKEKQTQDTFGAMTALGEGPFLRTGDFGVFIDRQLVVTGRLKEMIVMRGKNYYPHDFEETVSCCHKAIQAQGVAAFSVEADQKEVLVLVCEITRTMIKKIAGSEVYQCIQDALLEAWDLTAGDIVLIKVGQLPKTSSGKIQRKQAQALYQENRLESIISSYQKTQKETFKESQSETSSFTASHHLNSDPTDISQYILQELENISGFKVKETDAISRLAIDSVKMMMFISKLEDQFQCSIDLSIWFGLKTIQEMIHYCIQKKNLLLHEKEGISDADFSLATITPQQKQILLFEALNAESLAYHLPFLMRLDGKVNIHALRQAFVQLVNEHQVLRSYFVRKGGDYQVNFFLKDTWQPEIIEAGSDYSEADFTTSSFEKTLTDAMRDFSAKAFNTSIDYLIRVKLVHIKGHAFSLGIYEKVVVMLVVHHTIVDGGSLGVMFQALKEYYQCAIQKVQKTQEHHFYSLYQKSLSVHSEQQKESIHQKWKEKIRPKKPYIEWIQNKQNFLWEKKSSHLSFVLDLETSQKVRGFCQENKFSIFNVLYTAFQSLLMILSGERNFCIHIPVNTRNNIEAHQSLGFWVKTAILPTVQNESSVLNFKEMLKYNYQQLKEIAIDKFVDFHEIIEDLQIQRDSVYDVPYSQVFFSAQNINFEKFSEFDTDVHLTPIPFFNDHAKYDLCFILDHGLVGHDDCIQGTLEWRQGLFQEQEWVSWLEYYKQILLAMFAAYEDERQYEGKYVLSLDDVRQEKLIPKKKAAWYKVLAFLEAVEEKRLESDQPYLVLAHQKISYHVFIDQTRKLIQALIDHHIRPFDRAILLLKSADYRQISLWSCLQYQITYIPVDDYFGIERIQSIIEKTAPQVILIDHPEIEQQVSTLLKERQLANLKIIQLKDVFSSDRKPASFLEIKKLLKNNQEYLLYIIFTSGSTGAPKGAGVTLDNFSNLIHWYKSIFSEEGNLCFLNVSSFAFDLTQKNLILSFLSGGKLLLLENHFDLHEIHACLQQEKANIINCSPSVFKTLLYSFEQKNSSFTFSTVILGGEPLDEHIIKKIHNQPGVSLINSYGPTECSDVVLYHVILDHKNLSLPVQNLKHQALNNLGQAIPNVIPYVASAFHTLLPPYAKGELYIAGAAVGVGYIGDEIKTREKFIKNPWGEGLLYQTGDQVFYDEKGDLYFVGRSDDQIKLRGLRVDLMELTQMIKTRLGFENILIEKIDENLILFVASLKETIFDRYGVDDLFEAQVLDQLKEFIPLSLLPNRIILIEQFPLNQNGKIDKRLLRAKVVMKPCVMVKPQSLWDHFLVEIISEKFQLQSVSLSDQFFKLGGSSLSASELILKIYEEKNVLLTLSDFYQALSLADLSKIGEEKELSQKNIQENIGEIQQKNLLSVDVNQIDISSSDDFVEYENFILRPLSTLQLNIATYGEIYPESSAYNITFGYVFDELIDEIQFKKVIFSALECYPLLRSKLVHYQEKKYLRYEKQVDFNKLDHYIESVHFIGGNESFHQKIQKELNERHLRVLRLENTELLKVIFYQWQEKSALIICVHHLIFDGFSLKNFCEFIGKNYHSLGSFYPKNKLVYVDRDKASFLARQSVIASNNLCKAKEFWESVLKTQEQTLFYSVGMRKKIYQAQSTFIKGTFNQKLTSQLMLVSFQYGLTPYAVLFATFLIWKKTQTSNIYTSTAVPTSIREVHQKDEIGCFIQVLPFNHAIDLSEQFFSFVKTIQNKLSECYTHSFFDFSALGFPVNRSEYTSYLIQDVFNYLEGSLLTEDLNAFKDSKFISPLISQPKYEFVFSIYRFEHDWQWEIEFRSDCFKDEDFSVKMQWFEYLLSALLYNPERSMTDSMREVNAAPVISNDKRMVSRFDYGFHYSLSTIESILLKEDWIKKCFLCTLDGSKKTQWILLLKINHSFFINQQRKISSQKEMSAWVNQKLKEIIPDFMFPQKVILTNQIPGQHQYALNKKFISLVYNVNVNYLSFINLSLNKSSISDAVSNELINDTDLSQVAGIVSQSYSLSAVLKAAINFLSKNPYFLSFFDHGKLKINYDFRQALSIKIINQAVHVNEMLYSLKAFPHQKTLLKLFVVKYQPSLNKKIAHIFMGVRINHRHPYMISSYGILNRWESMIQSMSQESLFVSRELTQDCFYQQLKFYHRLNDGLEKNKVRTRQKQSGQYSLSLNFLNHLDSLFSFKKSEIILSLFQIVIAKLKNDWNALILCDVESISTNAAILLQPSFYFCDPYLTVNDYILARQKKSSISQYSSDALKRKNLYHYSYYEHVHSYSQIEQSLFQNKFLLDNELSFSFVKETDELRCFASSHLPYSDFSLEYFWQSFHFLCSHLQENMHKKIGDLSFVDKGKITPFSVRALDKIAAIFDIFKSAYQVNFFINKHCSYDLIESSIKKTLKGFQVEHFSLKVKLNRYVFGFKKKRDPLLFERISLDVNSKSEDWISYLNNLFFNLNFEDQASVFQVKIIYLQDVISVLFSCHALFLDEKMLEKIANETFKKIQNPNISNLSRLRLNHLPEKFDCVQIDEKSIFDFLKLRRVNIHDSLNRKKEYQEKFLIKHKKFSDKSAQNKHQSLFIVDRFSIEKKILLDIESYCDRFSLNISDFILFHVFDLLSSFVYEDNHFFVFEKCYASDVRALFSELEVPHLIHRNLFNPNLNTLDSIATLSRLLQNKNINQASWKRFSNFFGVYFLYSWVDQNPENQLFFNSAIEEKNVHLKILYSKGRFIKFQLSYFQDALSFDDFFERVSQIIFKTIHFKDKKDFLFWVSKKEISKKGTLKKEEVSLFESQKIDFSYLKKSIYSLFSHQLSLYPDRVAIEHMGKIWSYGDLNSFTYRMARAFREKGIKKGDIVILYHALTPEIIATLLACVSMGVIYVPVDRGYPVDRVKNIIKNSGAHYVVTDFSSVSLIQEFDIDRIVFSLEMLSLELDLEKNQFSAHSTMDISHGEDELYYIFTSGSTGVPKGAKVRHDGFLNLLAWLVDECQSFIPQVYLLSSFGFDLTQKNIFLPLITGGTLYLPSSHFFDPFDLMRHLKDKSINYINCAPSLFYSFLDFLGKNKEMGFLSSLHLLMLGGEKFDLFRIKHWIESSFFNADFINSYGPTECTDVVSSYRLYNDQIKKFILESQLLNQEPKIFPIGLAIPNVMLTVIDPYLRMLPPYHIGELLIAGVCVGNGYIHQKEDSSFIESPYGKGQAYRTGDFVYQDCYGLFHYVGRIDQQVKLHGIRIELSEIEKNILMEKEIKEAVVLLLQDQLIAFYEPLHSEVASKRLRENLELRLTPVMIPHLWIPISKWPVNAHGKIDKPALIELSNQHALSQKRREKAVDFLLENLTQTEKDVLNLWKETLQNQKISIESNIFDMGAHSLSILKIASLMKERLHLMVSPIEFFKHPIIKDFCFELNNQHSASSSNFLLFSTKEKDSQGERNNEEEKYPLSLDQQRLWYAMLQESTAFSYNVLSKIEVRGDFNLQCIPNILEFLLQKFDALQLSFSEFEPLQSMNSSKNWLIDIRDLSLNLDKEADILHTIEKEKSRNFLKSPAAWSFHFFKYDKSHCVFIFNFSHLIVDGWSLVHFIDSFFSHYFYLMEKKSSTLSHSLLSHALKIQPFCFSDYVASMRHPSNRVMIEKNQAYWESFFSAPLASLDFPIIDDQKNNADMGCYQWKIEKEAYQKARTLAKENKVSLSNVFFLAYFLSIYKLYATKSFVIGSIYSGRNQENLSHIFGFLVKQIFVQFSAGHNCFIKDLLFNIESQWNHALAHSMYDIEALIDFYQKSHHKSYFPGLNIAFIWQGNMLKAFDQLLLESRSLDLALSFEDIPLNRAKFDFGLTFFEKEDHLYSQVEYRCAKFLPEFVQDFSGVFSKILDWILSNFNATFYHFDEFFGENHSSDSFLNILQRDYFLSQTRGGLSHFYQNGLSSKIKSDQSLSELVFSIKKLISEIPYLSSVIKLNQPDLLDHSATLDFNMNVDDILSVNTLSSMNKILAETHAIEKTVADWLGVPILINETQLFQVALDQVGDVFYFSVKAHCMLFESSDFYHLYEKLIGVLFFHVSFDSLSIIFNDSGKKLPSNQKEKIDFEEDIFYWSQKFDREIYSASLKLSENSLKTSHSLLSHSLRMGVIDFCHQHDISLDAFFSFIYFFSLYHLFDIKTDFVVEFFSFSLKQKESFLRPLFVLIELKELFDEDFILNNVVKVETMIQEAHQHSNVSFEIFNQKIEDAMAIFAFSFVDFSDSAHPVFDFSLPQLHRFHASVLVLNSTIELRFSWPSEWMQDACFIDRFEKIIACVLNHDVFSRSDLFMLSHERHIISDVKDHSLVSLLSDFSLSSAGVLLQRYLESNRSDVLLAFGEHLLSSRAFAIKVCELAHILKTHSVQQPSKMAVVLPYSVSWFVTVWAAATLGITYVPIDYSLPIERKKAILASIEAEVVIFENEQDYFLLENSHMTLIVYVTLNEIYTKAKVGDQKNKSATFNSFTNIMRYSHSFSEEEYKKSPLYYIHTSGSTGMPKAAGVSYASFDSLLTWYCELLSQFDDPVMLLASHFSFDLTQKNIFSSVLLGIKCIIPETHPFDVYELIALISKHQVSIVNLSPSIFYAILDCAEKESLFSSLESLEGIILGGEPIHPARFMPWLQWKKNHQIPVNVRLFNSYGPTECTDVVSSFEWKLEETHLYHQIPLGRPLPHVDLLILNHRGYLLPDGFKGMLYIAGQAVGLGYWKNDIENHQKFINHAQFGKIYHSGDIAYIDEHQSVHYVGRIDHQVKLRGVRLELSEIEWALKKQQGVKEAVCIVHDHRLIAYIEAEREDDSSYFDLLSKELPRYCIPDFFMYLSEWPLTPNGKVDRKKLPQPFKKEKKYRQPETKVEKLIYDLVKEVLLVSEFCIEDDFFALGGHSILAVRLYSRIKSLFQLDLPVSFVFDLRSVHKMAQVIDAIGLVSEKATDSLADIQQLPADGSSQDFDEFEI